MSDAALTLPYTGLRVLDLSQGIAGPYCAGLLGMQGADVIKVEPPGGDWIRITGGGEQGMTALAVMGNLCKRSACIDATRPEGRALLLSMAKGADVFLQNLRPGVIERLGLDYATLSKDNPKLVYLSITGFGPRGPEAKRAGTDSVLQAFTGIANINRESDGTPRRIPFLIFLLAVYMVVRTAFVFLSPIGAPAGMVDMRLHDAIFSRILGTWTFMNEFVFSGHTSIPFLFFLFFKTPGLKRLMLVGSIVMAVAVLLSRNHYTVDVLGAFFTSYSVYALARAMYKRALEPLFKSTTV